MLALIRKRSKHFGALLLIVFSAGLAACATEKKVALVDDPNGKQESQLPWNRQEKWETGGQFANMTDRR